MSQLVLSMSHHSWLHSSLSLVSPLCTCFKPFLTLLSVPHIGYCDSERYKFQGKKGLRKAEMQSRYVSGSTHCLFAFHCVYFSIVSFACRWSFLILFIWQRNSCPIQSSLAACIERFLENPNGLVHSVPIWLVSTPSVHCRSLLAGP